MLALMPFPEIDTFALKGCFRTQDIRSLREGKLNRPSVSISSTQRCAAFNSSSVAPSQKKHRQHRDGRCGQLNLQSWQSPFQQVYRNSQ